MLSCRLHLCKHYGETRRYTAIGNAVRDTVRQPSTRVHRLVPLSSHTLWALYYSHTLSVLVPVPFIQYLIPGLPSLEETQRRAIYFVPSHSGELRLEHGASDAIDARVCRTPRSGTSYGHTATLSTSLFIWNPAKPRKRRLFVRSYTLYHQPTRSHPSRENPQLHNHQIPPNTDVVIV